MTQETVVYENKLNLVSLNHFDSMETNMFFVLCNRLKEQNTRLIEISFKDIKRLINYKSTSKERFIKDVEALYNKIFGLTYRRETDNEIEVFVLFTKVRIDKQNEVVQVGVNPDLAYILNDITGNFTKFELNDLVKLQSTYSKNMFRILKQYRHTGYFKIRIDDFRERLNIPQSYRMSNIDQKVLKPIIRELGTIFPELNINKIKAKRGRKIEWIEFIFKAEKRVHSKKQSKPPAKKKKGHVSKEKTPEWVLNRDQPQTIQQDEAQLQKDRQAFLERLKRNWGDKD
ncbi:TPA: RepB family plasmid replication initiator protein [Staphylococcus aureus]|nr:RepB family plasmid replication initiator protein [Staphylococcus aureus]HDY5190405.1 RepB family plasmid replication initiator protein [Staphylococcus aureus]HDY5793608.1 RepB family plasmid replication initiator protein [Staphylococcus aureus]